jgi:hypothetical protein
MRRRKGAMTNSTELKRALNPEEAIRFLSDRLCTSLALMHRDGSDLVSSGLAALPRGSRLLLASLGALKADPHDPSEFVLTPAGRELAASCAIAGLSPEVQQTLVALEQERARRAATGEGGPDIDGECIEMGKDRQ